MIATERRRNHSHPPRAGPTARARREGEVVLDLRRTQRIASVHALVLGGACLRNGRPPSVLSASSAACLLDGDLAVGDLVGAVAAVAVVVVRARREGRPARRNWLRVVTVDEVGSVAARDGVAAERAPQRVVALAAVNEVVKRPTEGSVGSIATRDRVVAAEANTTFVPCAISSDPRSGFQRSRTVPEEQIGRVPRRWRRAIPSICSAF